MFEIITLIISCVSTTVVIRVLIKEIQLLRIIKSDLKEFIESYRPEYFEKKLHELSLKVENLKKEYELAVEELIDRKTSVEPRLSSILEDEFFEFRSW